MMDDGTRRNRSQAKDFVWEEEKKENQFPGCFMASPKEDTRHKHEREEEKVEKFLILPRWIPSSRLDDIEKTWKVRNRGRKSLKVSMLSLLGNNLSWYRLVVAVVSSKLETFLSSFLSVSSTRSYRGENDYTLKIFGEKEGMNLWNWDSFGKVFLKIP